MLGDSIPGKSRRRYVVYNINGTVFIMITCDNHYNKVVGDLNMITCPPMLVCLPNQ